MKLKQYNTLTKNEKYKRNMYSAVHASSVQAFYVSELNELEEIYNELGYKLTSRKCGYCILSMFRTLANEVENYEKQRNERKSNSKASEKEEIRQEESEGINGSEEGVDIE